MFSHQLPHNQGKTLPPTHGYANGGERTYEGINVKIERLHINQSDLNTKRMLDLMAVNQDDGAMPLYLHAITRILREMRLIQQKTNGFFNYADFKRKVANS